MNTRTVKDGPWCWQSKEALRLLAEHFGESNRLPAARTVYLALCELASNEQAESFQAKVATIAKFAGVSGRTVHDVLPEMELIRVVSIDRNAIPGSKLKAPSTYTLTPICNGFTSIGDNRVSICNGPERPSVAENLNNLEKNLSEESQKETIPAPSASGFKVLVEDVEKLYQAYPRKEKPIPAKKAIGKALKIIAGRGTDDPVGWLIARVETYARSRNKEDAQFTRYPATWFNAGSYDVEPAAKYETDALGRRRQVPDYSITKLPTAAQLHGGFIPDAGGSFSARAEIDGSKFASWMGKTYPSAKATQLNEVPDYIIKEFLKATTGPLAGGWEIKRSL